MTASPSHLWPDEWTTLTATANQDVGPTPYYITIYDDTLRTVIANCGTGTTCSVQVTNRDPITRRFQAFVSPPADWYPPPNPQATAETTVTWRGVRVVLAATPSTVPVDGVVTLTAKTDTDVGPTPLYIYIFDTATGASLARCSTGTECHAQVTQSVANTRRYVAYVAHVDVTYPSSNRSASPSSFVTWTNSGWELSISYYCCSPHATPVLAKANKDIGPTPYYILFFDPRTGALLDSCAYATEAEPCIKGFHSNIFVAFVAPYSSEFPPADVQASSNVLFTG